MLTAITVLLITSVVGGVFGSVATYTYVDESDGKYCDKMSDEVLPEEDYYYNEEEGDYYSDEYSPTEEDWEEE
jgi:hypothetical protein